VNDDRISRDDTYEILAKEFWGHAWVPYLTAEEYRLNQENQQRIASSLKPPPELADKIYAAEERCARSDRQYRQLNNWLEDRGFDCVRGLKDGFDRQEFASAYAKAFGRVLLRSAQRRFRNPDDAKLVRDAIALLERGKAANVYQAAKQVFGRSFLDADGQPIQDFERLRKAIGREYRTAKHRQS
jgi:hypothetical protein